MARPLKVDEALPPGTRFDGKWLLERLLGSGSTAHVYAAKHIYGFDAALKIMHPSLVTSRTRAKRFLEQGYLSNQVAHPAMVRIYDDGVSDSGPYLVMDRVDGETLEAKLQALPKGEPLPAAEALRIGRDLLAFVVAIHAGNLTHRSLNPTEILVARNGQLRVIDFDSGQGRDAFTEKNLSLAPPASRSPTYFPPELAAASAVDGQADMWACGAVLYRMLAGRPPFVATPHAEGSAYFNTERVGPPLTEVRPDLPPALTASIERALLPDPAMRFSSAEALLAAIVRSSPR